MGHRIPNEEGYVKKVGWRIIRGIQLSHKTKKAAVFKGYYLRHPRGYLEEGFQRVPVKCVLNWDVNDKWDDRWEVIEGFEYGT